MDITVFKNILCQGFQKCQIFSPEIPAGTDPGFVFFWVELNGREFLLRLIFNKLPDTSCEVIFEETKKLPDPLIAQYFIETPVNNIKPNNVTSFDCEMLSIMNRLEYAFQHS